MIKLDTSEKQVKYIYLGIGSNLGNRKKNINTAKLRLTENNILILKSSNFYESLSWPNYKNPKFLNIVLKIDTSMSVSKLLKVCKNIEKSLGRKKNTKNAPRECDIDILDYKQRRIKAILFYLIQECIIEISYFFHYSKLIKTGNIQYQKKI